MRTIQIATVIDIVLNLGLTAGAGLAQDRQTPVSATQTYSHRCIHIKASDAAAAARQILGEPLAGVNEPAYELSTDIRSNTLHIKGPAARIAQAKAVLVKFDVAGAAVASGDSPSLQTYTAPDGKAADLAKALQEIYKSQTPFVRVAALGGERIMVYAGPEHQEAIARLLKVFGGAPAKRKAHESKDLIRITPTEFFSSDLKRLKPHVDFQGFCFKIKTHGSLRCWPKIEMWCDGKEIERPGRSQGFLADRGADEISLSYRRCEAKDGTTQYLVHLGGILADRRLMDEPKSKQEITVAFGPTTIRAPVELKAERESVIVWAVGTGRAIDLANPSEAEKNLKAAPWALVLRMYAERVK